MPSRTGSGRTGVIAIAALLASAVTGFTADAVAQNTIKLGGLATLEGPFAVPGQDSMRGIELAIAEFGGEVGGKKIVLIKGSSDGDPDKAINATRKLVEQDNVDIMIGPLSGSEGLAVKDYAKTKPDKTFVNGSSGAQDTTLRDSAPNFYRFNADGAQMMAGLGTYAFKEKGYKRVALIAEDYSFPYTQVFGFMLEYCALGGKVPEKLWVPLGNKDYSSFIAKIPEDVDALFVVLGGSDAVNFLSQYQRAGGNKPLMGGSITVDQTVLASKGRIRDALIGMSSAGPIADAWDDPRWQKFVADYKKKFPDGLPSPSLFADFYYRNTKAVLVALKEVNGDLSDGQKKFRAALTKTKLDSPTGDVVLDENRQGSSTAFVTEVTAESKSSALYNKVVKVTPNVDQTLGIPREKFLAYGPVSRDNPQCK